MSGGQWKSGVLLGGATILGAMVAALLIPSMFARIETDLERTKFLLASVKDVKSGRLPPPEIVVLGNSVTMNGVDSAVIAKALEGSPRVYNFSSTGQSVAEGYLYLQELPKETKAVVLVVSPGNLEDDKLPSPDVYNTFYMQGYRPSARTLNTLERIFKDPKQPNATDFLSRNEVQQRFHSRWAVSQVPDTEFRKRIRKDLDTSNSIKSLTYPAPYSKPISKSNFKLLLPTYNKERSVAEFAPLKTQIELINQIKADLSEQGRRLFIVLAPMHPKRLTFLGPKWDESLRQWAAAKPFGEVPMLDLSQALERDDLFLDVVHPSREGADMLSSHIAVFLATELGGAR